jgi:hypothetical protein
VNTVEKWDIIKTNVSSACATWISVPLHVLGLLILVLHIICVLNVIALSRIVRVLFKLTVQTLPVCSLSAQVTFELNEHDDSGHGHYDSASRTLRLHNGLHVPRVASNIISVRGLLMCGLHVVYELDSVRVSLPGRFSISSTWDRDAYRIPSTAVCARVRTSSSSDIRLWHRIFGHLGFGNLSR